MARRAQRSAPLNSTPIVPAVLEVDAAETSFSSNRRRDADPSPDARAQASRFFIDGNALPARWQSANRFVVLDTGFGPGHNFLATWHAWRDDPRRCSRLVYISIEQHPLTGDALTRAHRSSGLTALADELRRSWPPLTHNLHRLSFDDDRVELLLAFGDLRAWLPEVVAEVDAFYLTDLPADAGTEIVATRFCKALGRLAAPGATLAAPHAARALRAGLMSAGFVVPAEPRDDAQPRVTLARYAPVYVPRRAPSRGRAIGSAAQHAIVIGAGLAGCATAAALARHGWCSTVLERRTHIAADASGNAGGLFHGIVNAHDGLHARFNRAAALAAHGTVQAALRLGVAGNAEGLLRLETALDVTGMQGLLRRLALPTDWVQALSALQAGERAGLAIALPCWFYPSGGWVDPRGLAAALLARAGELTELRTSVDASRLERIASGGWCVLDSNGEPIAEAATVVLANAGDAPRLLRASGIAADWPLDSVRGQVSWAPAARLASPRVPIAGSGYLVPAFAGRVMFGATAQPGDADPAVRERDHNINLALLARLLGRPSDLAAADLDGRTAWRCSARDRLPVIGAVPDGDANAGRLDQPRFVPREPGLHVFTGLGSRGITWCTLGAALLAAGITGAPAPVEAGLLDAVDPARFVSRRARRATPARAG